MRIDVHAHINPGRQDAPTPETLCRYADRCRLDLVLVANQDAASMPPGAVDQDEADANAACLRACECDPRLGALYWLRPGRPDSNVRTLAGALTTEAFCGVFLSPAEAGIEPAAEVLDRYLNAIETLGHAILVRLQSNREPPHAYDLACRHPRVPVILCQGNATTGTWAAILDVVALAARRETADLYVATSHAQAADILTGVQALGADRVLYGSDALAYGESHAERQAAILDALRTGLPQAAFAKVAGLTAGRLFAPRVR